MTKRLPPFAKAIRARLVAGDLRGLAGTSPDRTGGTLWIACGSQAWEAGRYWQTDRLGTLLPPGERPDALDWCPVLDPRLDVLLVRCGAVTEPEVAALAVALLRAGAEFVLTTPPPVLRFMPRRPA